MITAVFSTAIHRGAVAAAAYYLKGTVPVRVGGNVKARVLKPLPMGADAQALATIRQWKFRPGTLNGQPVPVYDNLTVSFRLQ